VHTQILILILIHRKHTVVGKQFHPQSDSNNSQSSIILLIAEKRSKKKEMRELKETGLWN